MKYDVVLMVCLGLGVSLAACKGSSGNPATDGGSGGQNAGSGGTGGPGSGGAGSGGSGSGGTGSGGSAPVEQTCVPPSAMDSPPEKLSQTGCVDPAHPTMMAASVIPYEVNSPLWSDGAAKTRGMALPKDGKIQVRDCSADPNSCPQGPADDGKWAFPVGTVMVKNFLFDDKLVETRLFVHFDQATWVGYSYQWDEAQTDATIVPDDRVKVTFDTGTRQVEWHYPNRLDCLRCHDPTAGSTLGPETAQLNRVVDGMNQIDKLAGLGAFDQAPAKPYKAALVTPYAIQNLTPPSGATLEQRARSYLHANCGNCHRPDGEFPNMDLRFDTPLKDTHICGVTPEKGAPSPDDLIVSPGMPEHSVSWLRMNTPPDPAGGKTARMPQIATYVIDQQGLDLVGQWITSLTSCPQ